MKKIGILILSICLCFSFFLHQSHASEGNREEKKIVVVGWYEQDGYFQEDSNGKLTGFGADYLNAIAYYTGWEYRFVKGNRRQCLTWLESGQIDLLSPVKTTRKLSNAKTAREVIGDDYGYIYKRGNNFALDYGDGGQIENVTLGIEEGSGLEESLKRYCRENNFQFFEVVVFQSIEEMQNQLAEEKIDAMVTDSFVNLSGLKVVGRFSNGQVTFASAREDILEELDRTMEEIKLNNPGFTEDLRKLYFSESSHDNLEYSRAEQIFLKTESEYDVVLVADQYPICYQLGTSGEFKGIALDILTKIEHYTGLSFNIHYVQDYAAGKEWLDSGRADILGSCVMPSYGIQGVSKEDEGVRDKEEYTTQFYEMDMAFVGKRNTRLEDALKVAVPEYFAMSMDKLKSLYPQYEYLIYANDTACFEAILNHEADMAVQSQLKINELSLYEKYKDIQNLKYIPGNYIARFVIKEDKGLLTGIFDKAISSISEGSQASIVNNNIRHISIEQFSFWDFLVQYKEYLAAGLLLIMLLNFGQGYYRKYKEELKKKEIAYRDSVANISSMEKFRLDVVPILQSDSRENYYALAVDVDKFKVVNDLYGYDQGDRVIAFLAGMLKTNLTKRDYITRSNADNFIIMKYSSSLPEIEDYLKKVFASVESVLQAQGTYYHLILKAGIYHLDEGDNVLSSIIDKANLAKHYINQCHRSTYKIYEENMRQQNIRVKGMENEMEEALRTGQFCIYLQPQVDFATKKVISAEALVRWKHPREGMISPDQFIPVFEKNGFITRLDFYVWEEAIRTLARWREQHKPMVPIAINLSRIDIRNEELSAQLRRLMDKYGLESRWIKTELTESICLDGDGLILKRMNELKKLGFKIAIDDFGSGYSSLHLLKNMPIDILKIDKSFLDFDLDMDIRDEIVIRDIVDMGKHLELQIIVEGVETQEQNDFLEKIGCDIGQGFYYGRPMPVEEFEALLMDNRNPGGEV